MPSELHDCRHSEYIFCREPAELFATVCFYKVFGKGNRRGSDRWFFQTDTLEQTESFSVVKCIFQYIICMSVCENRPKEALQDPAR